MTAPQQPGWQPRAPLVRPIRPKAVTWATGLLLPAAAIWLVVLWPLMLTAPNNPPGVLNSRGCTRATMKALRRGGPTYGGRLR